MSANAPFERRIAAMLADEALIKAPERVLESAIAQIDTMPQRRSWWSGLSARWATLPARQRVLLVGAALLTVSAAAVGAALLRPFDAPVDPSQIILVRRAGPPELPSDISVVAIDAAGTERVLATITPDQLGGTFDEISAAISADGYLAVPTQLGGEERIPAVVDLRDRSAPIQRPDADGYFPAFGPDGRLAMQSNDGNVAVFDPTTGSTRWFRPPTTVSLLLHGNGPAWTTDGRLLAELATGRDLPEFVGVDDSGATSTAAAGFYSGIGPRRTDLAGRMLRCGITGDWPCDGTLTDLRAVGPTGAPTVWSENDPAIAVPDWSWATDGGLWLLVESTRPGPREVVLRRVLADGSESVVATFQGVADDPDPTNYQATAAFAGFAPDDSRVLVTLNGDVDTPTATWSVDARTGRVSRLGNGVLAGWLDPATLAKPREAVERIPETPEVIRGQWSDGSTSIRIGRSGITLRTGMWIRPTVQVRATGADTIAIDGLSFIPGCGPESAGYRWSAAGETLTLTAFDEPCRQRGVILGRTFERAIAFTDSSRPTVEPGTRYLVSDLPAPFRVTVPAGRSVDVDQRSGSSIQFRTNFGDASVTIFVPNSGGGLDPCYRGSVDMAIDLRSGFDAILAYLERSEVIGASMTDPLTVGTQAVPSLMVRQNASSACEAIRLFGIDSPISLELPTRLAFVEAPDGARLVVAVWVSTASRPVAQPWVDQLLASIEWLP